jgi:8-oxo-dGTP pyrophosphatase MutT (NUDIX family)
MEKEYAIYWVAFKVLLRKGNKILFLTDSLRGLLDLPGGRADYNEGERPLRKIIEREVREELGNKIKYRLESPVFQYRRHDIKKKMYNLITVYEAKYISGSIELSTEHNKYQWLDPKQYRFKEKDFYTKEEYESFREYFKNKK